MSEPKFKIGDRVTLNTGFFPEVYIYDVMYSKRYDYWTYVLGGKDYPYEGFYDEESLRLNEETPGS